MSSYLSRREIDDLHPDLEKIVYKVLGNSDQDVIATIEHSLHNGMDRRTTADNLKTLVDSKKISRLTDKLQDLLDGYKSGQRTRKRGHAEDDKDKDSKRSKSKYDKPEKVSRSDREREKEKEKKEEKREQELFIKKEPIDTSNLSTSQIKMMMANAQREIEERKRALSNLKIPKDLPPVNIPPGAPGLNSNITIPPPPPIVIEKPVEQQPPQPPVPSKPEDLERAKKIAELQAQIKAKLSGTLANILPPVIDKPKPLILDSEGRTVDKSGREINIPTLAPTLKANIRAKKREHFKAQMTDRMGDEFGETTFFDDRIMLKPAIRNKRSLRFHEPGKFQQMAERMRMKSQLEKLQNEISQIARKTGISSATKLALIAPKQDSHLDEVPSMEWWDSVILTADLNTLTKDEKISIREVAVTNLIEHPTQMRPPSE